MLRSFPVKWTLVLLFVVGTFVSAMMAVGAWTTETDSLHRNVSDETNATAATLEEFFLERTKAMRRMAKRWQEAGGTPEIQWRADARSYMQDEPGLLALGRSTSAGVVDWVEPQPANKAIEGFRFDSDPVRAATFQKARESRAAAVAGPVNLMQGGAGFVVMQPLFMKDGTFDGVLSAGFRATDFFRLLIDPVRISRFEIGIWAGDKPLLQSMPEGDLADESLSRSAPLHIGDAVWTVELRPSAAQAAAFHSAMPFVIFVIGLVGTLVLTYTLHLSQVANARAIAVAEVNREASFRQHLIDQVAVVAITDPQGVITFVNDAFCRLSGYRPEDVVGRTHSVISSGHHPPEFFAELWATIKAGRVWHGEILNRTKSGRLAWMDTTIVPDLGKNGEIIRYVAVRFDISGRVLADIRFRAAIDNMESGFALFDAEDRLVVYNRGFADDGTVEQFGNLTGLTFEEIFRSFSKAEMTAVDARTDPEAWFKWRMEMHRNPPDRPLVVQWTDGRWMRVTERKTTDGGTIGIWTDITDAKMRELDLELARDQMEEQAARLATLAEEVDAARRVAEEANQEKSRFLAGMSHELRTPLNAILGFSEMMQAEVFGPIEPGKYRQYVDHIHESGDHLLSLINDVLDLSKVEAGRMEISTEELSTDDLARRALSLSTSLLKGRDVRVESKVFPGCTSIFADERAVKQVMLNLLSNAIKFTPDGGRVDLVFEAGSSGGVIVRVRDTGIGMTASEMKVALEPYGQIRSEMGRKSTGTGLGLPLTKALIELHGGKLTVESVKGRGTTMSAFFPDRRVPEAPMDLAVGAA